MHGGGADGGAVSGVGVWACLNVLGIVTVHCMRFPGNIFFCAVFCCCYESVSCVCFVFRVPVWLSWRLFFYLFIFF